MNTILEAPEKLRSFDVGSVARLTHLVTESDVETFAKFSGDFNPIHMDRTFANRAGFAGRVVHGIVTAGLVSRVIGMQLPGAGSLWVKQEFEWLEPVYIGDRLEVVVTVITKSLGTSTVAVKVEVRNQRGRIVMQGNGVVRLPELSEQIRTVPLSERSVLITRGDGPLGVALAQMLAGEGAKVALLYSSHPDAALTAVDQIKAAGGQALAIECDVTETPGTEAALLRAREVFGKPVDVLINNGDGEFTPSAFPDMPWTSMEAQLHQHLKAAFLASQAVIPGMLEAGSGCIVHVGSTSAWNVPPGQWTSFVVAMAALQAFTKSLACELGPKNIRVNMVSAGMMEAGVGAVVPERIRKLSAMQTPLRRLASLQDICGAVRFMCSEQAEFITGADLPVCGGMAM